MWVEAHGPLKGEPWYAAPSSATPFAQPLPAPLLVSAVIFRRTWRGAALRWCLLVLRLRWCLLVLRLRWCLKLLPLRLRRLHHLALLLRRLYLLPVELRMLLAESAATIRVSRVCRGSARETSSLEAPSRCTLLGIARCSVLAIELPVLRGIAVKAPLGVVLGSRLAVVDEATLLAIAGLGIVKAAARRARGNRRLVESCCGVDRTGKRCCLGNAVVLLRKLAAVLLRELHVLLLHLRRSNVLLVQGCLFPGGWTALQATLAAHVTRMYVVVDDRRVVNVRVVHDVHVHVAVGGVVEEMVVVPVPTLIPVAKEAETVIDTAVVANVRTPVAGVPAIEAVVESPVAGRPEQAGLRRGHPCAGYPKVVPNARIPLPVAGSPDHVG